MATVVIFSLSHRSVISYVAVNANTYFIDTCVFLAESSVTGIARPMADSHRTVDADTVNGWPVPSPPVRLGLGTKAGPDGVGPPAPPVAGW
jgi:hypothetical protein